MNINQNNVTITERDFLTEKAFKEAYDLVVQIKKTQINDSDWNWVKVSLGFKDSLGKNYGLIEYFKEGDDNSTDHVDFEYEGENCIWKKETFERFIDAELSMVEMMRKRLEGKGNA